MARAVSLARCQSAPGASRTGSGPRCLPSTAAALSDRIAGVLRALEGGVAHLPAGAQGTSEEGLRRADHAVSERQGALKRAVRARPPGRRREPTRNGARFLSEALG